MNESSKQDEVRREDDRCQELEAAVGLWIAANQAKAERIAELEATCNRLLVRVARLSRRAGLQRAARSRQVRHAR